MGQEVMQLAWLFAERLRDRYGEKAAEVGLTAIQAKVLAGLDAARPLSMRLIARLIHVDPSNLTAIVDRLEDRGLVERRDSARDRRAKELVITDAGEAAVAAFHKAIAEDLGPLSNLEADQLLLLRDLLREVLGSSPALAAPVATDEQDRMVPDGR